MDQTLNPRQTKLLASALQAIHTSFTDLYNFVYVEVDQEKAADLPEGLSLKAGAAEVIKWANSEGLVGRLNDALRRLDNQNPKLIEYLKSLEFVEPQTASATEPPQSPWSRAITPRVLMLAAMGLAVLAGTTWAFFRTPDTQTFWEEPFLSQDKKLNVELWQTAPAEWKYGEEQTLLIAGNGVGSFPKLNTFQSLQNYKVKLNVLYQKEVKEVSWILRCSGGGTSGYRFAFTFPAKDNEEVQLLAVDLSNQRPLSWLKKSERRLKPLRDGDLLQVFATASGRFFEHKLQIIDSGPLNGLPAQNGQESFDFQNEDKKNAHPSGCLCLQNSKLLLQTPFRVDLVP